MSDQAISAQATAVVWTELRDERGKLCARIDGRLLLLEVRRNGETVIFDLREYMSIIDFYVEREERLER
jgi:hypothetical protein